MINLDIINVPTGVRDRGVGRAETKSNLKVWIPREIICDVNCLRAPSLIANRGRGIGPNSDPRTPIVDLDIGVVVIISLYA